MNYKLKNKIAKNALLLFDYGLNDLAWSREDALRLITSLMNEDIGVLGGDVYFLSLHKLRSLGDNWSCHPTEQEQLVDFYLRSKIETLRYIKEYPQNAELVFSITFSEDMTPSVFELQKLACKVCGRLQDEPPWGDDGQNPTFETCDCCGVVFGYDDSRVDDVKSFREQWLAKGAVWKISDERPITWRKEEQMTNIPKKYL